VNGPDDDKAFDEYLQRGSAVSKQYRAIEEERVPSELDANILASAASEVNAGRQKRTRLWRRWSVPVALAASTVLAVSIVLESDLRHEAPTVSYSTQTSAPPSRPEAQGREPEEPVLKEQANAVVESAFLADEQVSSLEISPPKQEEAERAPAATVPAEAPRSPTPASTPDYRLQAANAARSEAAEQHANAGSPATVEERAEGSLTRARDGMRRLAPTSAVSQDSESDRSTIGASARDSGAGLADDAKESKRDGTTDPHEWLQHIRELREAGKAEEADSEWEKFREAFPNYPVDKDDRAQRVR
jgi:hypothetical protein